MDRDDSFTRYAADAAIRNALQSAADLPTEHARSGQPTLIFRGARLHSAIDPRAEAAAIFESQEAALLKAVDDAAGQPVSCLLFGPGLGYVIRHLSAFVTERNLERQVRIVCVEADVEVARKALQLCVWEPSSARIAWIAGSTLRESLEAAVMATRVVTLRCTAGYRMNRDIYDTLADSLCGNHTAERPIRILVPTPLYGGSLPAAFHCADAFRKLGHSVELLDLSPYYGLFKQAETVTSDPRHRRTLQGLLTTHLAETIAARAMDWNADLVWALAQTPLMPAALQEMRHEGIHTALWFVEDYTIFNYWRDVAQHFDAVFTIQRGQFHELLGHAGAKNVAYLPCAANPDVHRPRQLTADETGRYGSAVSFVGAGYYNRQVLFSELPLPDFKIWGSDWPDKSAASRLVQENGRRITTEETAMIYSATRVNLNLHSSPNHPGVNPYGDFVNPRTFEIAACGGFQLVDARAELPPLLQPGREVAVFTRTDEIVPLVEYYLSHDEERQAMADRARARVLKDHTYECRMGEALAFLESRLPRLAARKRGPNYVSSLKQAVKDDPEIQEFLSAFPEDEEVDLDKIVARIQLGQGDLTRPEGLFLLMKEFRDWGREKGVIQ